MIQFKVYIFFSIMVYHRVLNIVPCAAQQALIVYPFYIVCICSSQTPNPSLSLSWQPQVWSLFLCVCFCFLDRFICIFYYFFSSYTTQHAELPQPAIKPVPPALEAWSLNWTNREVLVSYFRFHIQVISYVICLFLSDLLHLV